MFIDTHAHYDDESFDSDRDELLRSFLKNEIDKVITIGCDIKTSKASVELSNTYDFVYSAVGFHPHDASDFNDENADFLIKLAKENKKVVAWGEIGLDYHYSEPSKKIQKDAFIKQIEIANSLNLPISIHCRDAIKDTVDILKAYPCKAVFHCYSGSVETMKELVKMGYYISFSGTVSFKNAREIKEVARCVPSDRYFIETDCPYLSPEPNRGKRNSSLNLIHTAQAIADIRGVSIEKVAEETTNNALFFFDKLK